MKVNIKEGGKITLGYDPYVETIKHDILLPHSIDVFKTTA